MKTSCNYILVYDFETGNLCNSKCIAFENAPCVEIAMVCIDMKTLEIVDELDRIFPYNYKEDLIYSEQATAVHGITEQMQEELTTPLKDIYKELKTWFTKYKNPRQLCTLAGHNIGGQSTNGFDNPFLRNFFTYMNDDIDKYVKYYIDTMHWAHISSLEQENYQLGTCCQLAGIDLVDAHRALNDTKANAHYLISCIKKLRGEGQIIQKVEQKRYRDSFQLC